MPPVDVCAGWVADGFAVQGFTDLGPPLTIGPPPARASRDDDPVAWHPLAPDVARSTRRLRRLDLWIEDGAAHVDTYLQDSYVDGSGVASAVHEYGVQAELDRDTHRFVAAGAVPGRLPFPECPAAAASAASVVGTPTIGLRDRVSATLTGPASCTHLNDSLRALEAVGALLDELERHLSTAPPPSAQGQHETVQTQVEERQ